MPIDIDQLTEAELRDLNHRIVALLRFLQQMRAHASMLDFRLGERVRFQSQDRGTVTGMITRYNKKTVSLITDDGQRWNVSPQLLERAGSETRTVSPEPGNVVALPLPDKTSR